MFNIFPNLFTLQKYPRYIFAGHRHQVYGDAITGALSFLTCHKGVGNNGPHT